MSRMKTIRCIIRTVWYSFMLLLCKYAVNGFSNVTKEIVGKDLLFIIPATIYITAMTILMDNGIELITYFFQCLFKKRKKDKKA